MSVADLLNDVRMIDQSRPEYLTGVAAAWTKVAAALEAQKLEVVRALNRAADDWASQRVKVVNYAGEVAAGLDAVAAGANEVANALLEAAPSLQDLKSALGVAVTALGSSLVAALVTATGAAAIDVVVLVNLVNEYHRTMAVLAGALVRAQEKFDVLAILNSGSGVIPAPPELSATPD